MNSEKQAKVVKSAALILLVVLVVYFIVHSGTKNTLPPLPPPTVIVQKPKLMDVGEFINLTGNTVAYQSVNLVARVQGYLESIDFADGSMVKKGQQLFVIEPQPYLEQLKEAEASVAAQKAAYAYAVAEYARQQHMYKQNATSLKSVEAWLAKEEESQAEVSKAEANAVNAKIEYGYTHVNSPFNGRIGRHMVDVGNLVGHGEATVLANVEQIDPIYVYFNLNELDLISIREEMRARGFEPKDIDTIPVYVGLQSETNYPFEGKLDFVNTGLDASTGTMEFRAIVPNKKFSLVPGLFVNVRVPLSMPTPKLTVPETVIQYDQIGPYVLVVDKTNHVVLKRVTLGGLENGRRAISKGLDANDMVIIDGLQNATPTTQVNPKVQSG